jgi:hypothetical protein
MGTELLLRRMKRFQRGLTKEGRPQWAAPPGWGPDGIKGEKKERASSPGILSLSVLLSSSMPSCHEE